MSTYKPTEHDGLKQDGTEDKRVGTHEFAGGKVDPHEAGRKGGKSSGGSGDYDESGSGSTGSTDNRGSAKGEFAHGKVDPHEAGKKGGRSSGGDDE